MGRHLHWERSVCVASMYRDQDPGLDTIDEDLLAQVSTSSASSRVISVAAFGVWTLRHLG